MTVTTATATALLTATQALAARCDGALAADGAGFNGTDTKFGKRIAEHATVADLTSNIALAAEVSRMLQKYAGQIISAGLPKPPVVKIDADDEDSHGARETARVLERKARSIPAATLDGQGNITVKNSFSIKESLKKAGARWNGPAKAWDVPVANAGLLKKVIKADNITIKMTPEVEAVLAAARAVPQAAEKFAPRKITVKNDIATISFDRRDPEFGILLEAVRALPMRRWDAESKCWTVPVQPILFEFARDLGFTLPASVAAEQQARAEQAEKNVEQSRALSGDGEVALFDDLYPFQRAGVEYAVRQRRAMIADEMGLGKTRQAIAALETAECFPAVIVCPSSLKINWEKEFNSLVPHRSVVVVSGRKADYNIIADKDVIIVNYDVLGAWEPVITDVVGLVMDESHYIKNPKAQRTLAAHALAAKVPQ